MENLISCDICGIVFKDLFNRSSHLNFLFETNKKELFAELENKKYLIYADYSDIEQTTFCFIKWCPICNKVTYFNELK